MFSRIQTIFLIAAIAALSLSFIFPIATISAGANSIYYTNYGLKEFDAKGNAHIIGGGFIYIVAAIATLFLLIALFQFKKRKVQMLVCRVAYLVILTQSVLCFLLPDSAAQTIKLAGHVGVNGYGLGFYLPIVALAFTFLAELFIKKDERLVRSADRLR